MGKKGDLLRQNKKKTTVYTFTREQLEKHDMDLKIRYRQNVMETSMAQMEESWKKHEADIRREVMEEWQKHIPQLQTLADGNNFITILKYTLSVSAAVLIEDFGWKPLTGSKNDMQKNIVKFAAGLENRIDAISSDETTDLMYYSDEIFEKYGIRFAEVE